MDCKNSGSSKQRRDSLKYETELLGDNLFFTETGKLSQLRILKAACTFLKKEKHFSQIKNFSNSTTDYMNRFVNLNEMIRNDGILGFIVCFTKIGELIYLSDSITDYLGFNAMDLLLNYDYFYELAHSSDRQIYEDLSNNTSNGARFCFFSLLFASKVKRKQTSLSEYKLFKITGHFDEKTELFIATCVPVLSVPNREILTMYNTDCFTSQHFLDLKFHQLDLSAESLIGYNVQNDCMLEKSLYHLVDADSLKIIQNRHKELLITKNTKGYLDPIRLRHKNGYYISCLLNMYYDSNGSIICKYQIMSQEDISKYTEYKHGLFLNLNHSYETINSDKNEDDHFSEPIYSSDIYEYNNNNDNNNDNNNNNNVASKRSFEEDQSYEDDENLTSNKKIKIEPEFELESIVTRAVHKTLSRTSSATTKINNIKDLLSTECEILKFCSNLEEQNFHMQNEIKTELIDFYYENSFYDQNNKSISNGNNKLKFFSSEDEDEFDNSFSEQFDFSQTDWLENLEELC